MGDTKQLASIGFLCEQTHRGYFDVLETLTKEGVKPTMLLDLVPYFDWNAASRVLEDNPPMIRGSGRKCRTS